MTAIFSLNQWFEIVERGTSGDQVHDILYSWKAQTDEWANGLASQECGWLYMVDEGYYETKCNQSFYFVDGETLAENITFQYCPYCGKKINGDRRYSYDDGDDYDPSYEGLIPDEEV
jgi:hypothetical protein